MEVDTLLAGLLVTLKLFEWDVLRVLDEQFNCDAPMLVSMSGLGSVSLRFALCSVGPLARVPARLEKSQYVCVQ